MAKLDEVNFQQIPRAENAKADTLAKLASIPLSELGREVYVDQLESPSITKNAIMEVDLSPCWMDPIKTFIQTGVLPEDPIEAKRVARISSKFLLHEGKLLRKSIVKTDMHPFLHCLRPEEAELALREIHEGM